MTRAEYTKQRWLENHRITEDGEIERYCSSCNTWLIECEENFYYKNKSHPERGFAGECKQCAIKRADIVQRKNYNRQLESQKKYDRKPERLPIRREHARKTRESGYYDRYFAKYPERLIKYNEDRLHKNHNITKEEWKSCKAYFNNSCAYCGLHQEDHWRMRKGKLINMSLHKEHVDHKGNNNLSNCVPACQSCNDRKWKFILEEWYNENNKNFTEERLEKIMNWITGDYKQFEAQYRKPKGKYTKRKKTA